MSKKIEIDECGNINPEVSCKHFHQDPYWTPNNFDLYFDYDSIPQNIEVENSHDLIRTLQKHLPLSKILHLNMDDRSVDYAENFNLYTKSRLIIEKEDNGVIEKVVVDLK